MTKSNRPLPPVDELRHLFRYEPESGRLLWENPRSRTQKRGDEAGCETLLGHTRYRIVNIAKRLYLGHRLIWAIHHGRDPADALIDHIDRNGLNNRITNLRLADKRGNALNARMRADNTSGVVGVTFDASRGKWQAQIGSRGTTFHLGRYDTLADATSARRQAEERLHCL